MKYQNLLKTANVSKDATRRIVGTANLVVQRPPTLRLRQLYHCGIPLWRQGSVAVTNKICWSILWQFQSKSCWSITRQSSFHKIFCCKKATLSGKIKWSLIGFSGLYLCTKAFVMRKSQNILTLVYHNLADPQIRVSSDFQTSYDDANSLIIPDWILNNRFENGKHSFAFVFHAMKPASRITKY